MPDSEWTTPIRYEPGALPELLQRLEHSPMLTRPTSITTIGNPALLNEDLFGLFCSARCPGQLVLDTYALTEALRDAGRTVISGFHSPMEKQCLSLLLRGSQPIIICPARAIEAYRLPGELLPPLRGGRLLILSAFEPPENRVTAELAQRRNRFVAAVASRVFIAHAEPQSGTERLARELMSADIEVLTLPGEQNAVLTGIGAVPITAQEVRATIPSVDLADSQLPLFRQ